MMKQNMQTRKRWEFYMLQTAASYCLPPGKGVPSSHLVGSAESKPRWFVTGRLMILILKSWFLASSYHVFVSFYVRLKTFISHLCYIKFWKSYLECCSNIAKKQTKLCKILDNITAKTVIQHHDIYIMFCSAHYIW